MSNLTQSAIVVVLSLASLATIGAVAQAGDMECSGHAPTLHVAARVRSEWVDAEPEPHEEERNPIVEWAMAALSSWSTPSRDAEVYAFRRRWVVAFAQVAYDPKEPPLPVGPKASRRARATARPRTLLTLIGIGAHETGWQKRYADGDCGQGECDQNEDGEHEAVGPLQILPVMKRANRYGLRLVGLGFRTCSIAEAARERCITAQDLLDAPALDARLALHILRAAGLGGYTGQGPDGDAVTWIENKVTLWMRTMPPPLRDSQVAAPR